MGNFVSQRVNSPSSGLGFPFSNSITNYLIGFTKQKSIFIPTQSTPSGLTVIFQETIPLNSNTDFIVFPPPPPHIAIQLLYSAPAELWNWEHPKPRDFSASQTISARDGILIPTSPDEIICSEEYTCVISTKDGYSIMTHLYRDIVIDCHPIPESMAATTLGEDTGEPLEDHLFDDFVKNCYICSNNSKKKIDVNMQKDDAICINVCGDKKIETGKVGKKNNNLKVQIDTAGRS